MAEFGAASAAIGLAGNAISLVNYLRQVKAAMETVEDDIDDLITELESLERLYGSLETQHAQQPHPSTLNVEQHQLYTSLRQTLEVGRAAFNKLDQEVRIVYQGDPKTRGWKDALKKQHRFRSGNQRRSGFREQIYTYNHLLQMWLSRITLANQVSSQDFERDASTRLQELREGLVNMYERLKKSEQDWTERDSIFQSAAFPVFDKASWTALNKVRESVELSQQITREKHFDIPHAVDSCYVGREEEAQILATCIFAHSEGQPRKQKRFVIHGVGGSGKTQFCCKFAQDHQHRFWGVFCIDGRSHEHLKQSLTKNVAKRGKVDNNYLAALNWLANQEDPWLLIIDNADDPSIELRDYFPKGSRGYVLVTTRNPAYRSLGNVDPGFFSFHGLKNDDARQLLLRVAGLKSPMNDVASSDAGSSLDDVTPFATAIVETLGYLALAINVAGSAIGAGYCRIQGYLKFLEATREDRRRKKAAKARTTTEHHDLFEENRQEASEGRVEATFDVSYDAITKNNSRESKDALQLLKTFAFLHCEDFRFEYMKTCIENAGKETQQQVADKKAAASLIARAPPRSWREWTFDQSMRILTALHGSSAGVLPDVLREGRKQGVLDEHYEYRIRGAMRQLTQYSLATKNEKNDSWSMHPLVHTWAQEKIEREGQTGEQYVWCEAAATLLCNCVLLGQDDEEMMRMLLPHVDHVRREHKKLEKRIQDKRMSRMNPLPVFESGFSPQRALMLAKFSVIYASNGRFQDAVELQAAVQDFTVKVRGFRDEKTRRITKALADTLWHLGRGDDSAKLMEELIEACMRFCGPDHRETLTAKQKLGDSRWQQGRVNDAKLLYEEALSGLKNLYGEDDEDTLTCMDSLGTSIQMYGTDDAVSKAKKLYRTTLNARRRLYGQDDLKTLNSRELLYSAATWKGTHQELLEAETGMQEIIDIRKERLGREHAYTLLAMLNLARVKIELQKYEAADEIFDIGLPIAERNHGKDHMAVLFCRFHLGRLRARQGRWVEARDILFDVTERQKVCLQGWGKMHYDRIGALLELTKVYNALREHDACDGAAAEVLWAFEMTTTVEHPWARKLRADAAEWRRLSGRSVEAGAQ